MYTVFTIFLIALLLAYGLAALSVCLSAIVIVVRHGWNPNQLPLSERARWIGIGILLAGMSVLPVILAHSIHALEGTNLLLNWGAFVLLFSTAITIMIMGGTGLGQEAAKTDGGEKNTPTSL